MARGARLLSLEDYERGAARPVMGLFAARDRSPSAAGLRDGGAGTRFEYYLAVRIPADACAPKLWSSEGESRRHRRRRRARSGVDCDDD
jgi:hypothetical protein